MCTVHCLSALLRKSSSLDERQITHLICARLKYDLYDFFRGRFGPASCSFSCIKGPKNVLWKSHIDHILGGHRLDE